MFDLCLSKIVSIVRLHLREILTAVPLLDLLFTPFDRIQLHGPRDKFAQNMSRCESGPWLIRRRVWTYVSAAMLQETRAAAWSLKPDFAS